VIVDTLDLSAAEFEAGTGWQIKPEGACFGEVCVPLGSQPFDATEAAARLGMAVVASDSGSRWAIGPATPQGRALATAEAPELVLDGIDGTEFRLSALRGEKVVIVAWAPY
jgi:hypothetical protein